MFKPALVRCMNKRIREKIDSWDLKSLFLTILFLSIGFFLFFYFTDIRDRFRTEDKGKLKGQTTGEIINVEKLERISQSKWNGTKIYIDSYKVTYRYNIQGQTYQNIDIIPLTTTNQKLLTGILEIGTNNICVVKFDIDDPSKSLLIESE
jgi:hypothetical protein